MKVEILYSPGCPNHPPTVSRVREALAQEGISAELVQVEVNDLATALLMGFLGSPSVRIDGQDVEPSARYSNRIGMMCRTYSIAGQLSGVPPMEWLRKAVREAKECGTSLSGGGLK